MAKRIILIVVWTVAFALVSAFLFGLGLAFIGHQTSGGSQLDRNTALLIGILAFVPPMSGLIGLLLGILGKLPGTRRPPGSIEK